MLISEALRRFTSEYCYDHAYTKSTVDNYQLAVQCFIRSVGDIEVRSLTLDHIRQFRLYMESRNRDRNGVICYLYKTRCFLRWVNKVEKTDLNLDDIVIPKRRKTLPNYLTVEEIQKLLENGDNRERAIVSLLYSTAMRVGELTQVRLKDIQGDKIKIRGKGDTERIVFVDSTAQFYLNAYIRSRSDSSPYLFNSHKQPGLGKSRIQKLVKELGERAGLDKPVTPHVFRHSNATDLMKNGVGLRYIQEYLGHADISTTQIYTHVAQTDLTDQFHKGHKKLTVIA